MNMGGNCLGPQEEADKMGFPPLDQMMMLQLLH